MKKFQGTGVAIVTPFLSNTQVDYAALENLINYLIYGGVEYLVVQGTTGESVTLNKKEKAEVLEFVKEKVNKRVPIVLGHGGNDTQALVDGFANYNFTGVDAILSVSPYYSKPIQEGVYRHYMMVADASPVPVILYNVPGRTGSNMLPDTTLKLAHNHSNIIGIKEAAGSLDQVSKLLLGRPEGFLVISGDDTLALPHVAIGGDGVISVIANAYPKQFSEMIRLGLAGDLKAAAPMHLNLFNFTELLFAEGNPGGIKAALKLMNICGDAVRMPLWNVSDGLVAKLKAEIERIG